MFEGWSVFVYVCDGKLASVGKARMEEDLHWPYDESHN
jgi:hypothetical protein